MNVPKDSSLAGEYLVFTLDGEPCAITIRCVREVIQYRPTTAVPNAPKTIRGVIDLRGRVVPIVDLAAKFGFAQTPPTKWTCLIVVEATLGEERSLLALVADTVDDVIELRGEGSSSLPVVRNAGTSRLSPGAPGSSRTSSPLVLDVDRLLTLDEDPRRDAVSRPRGACAMNDGGGTTTGPRTTTMSRAEFALFQRLIRAETGISLSEAKRELLISRLSPRLRELGLASFSDYYRRIEEGDEAELVRMVDRISTNETQFFREPRHFEYLEQTVLPSWRAQAEAGALSRAGACVELRLRHG